jgi:hypothetical protein
MLTLTAYYTHSSNFSVQLISAVSLLYQATDFSLLIIFNMPPQDENHKKCQGE